MTDTKERILAGMKRCGLFALDGSGRNDESNPPKDQQQLFFKDATRPTAACNEGCYGLDSLDRVEMAMMLEEEFGIEISDDQVEKLNTLEDIVRFIDGPAE